MSELASRQKIVYVITRSDIGGAQNHTLSLIKAFHQRYDLMLIAGSEGVLTESAKALGMSVHVVKELDSFNVALAIWKLRNILSKECPDLVHTHSSLASFYGRAAAKLCGLKTLYTVHGWHFANEKNRLKWAIKVILEWCAGFCTDHWITVSAFDEKLGSAFHIFKPGKVDVIVNGVGDIERTNANGQLDAVNKPLEIVFVGRATYQKNCLAAVEVLEQTEPNINLTMFASGGIIAQLRTKIDNSRERHRIKLILNEPNAGLKMSEFDAMLITSRYEGMPLSVLEAMRGGLAIVSTDICGMNELIVNGENGFLFGPNDQVGMANQLNAFLHDREKLRLMGASSRQRYENAFRLNEMISATERVYKKVIAL